MARDFDLWPRPKTWAVERNGAPVLVIGPCSEAEALDTTDVLLADRKVLPGEDWHLVEVRP